MGDVMSTRVDHEFKSHPDVFWPAARGEKTFEYRRDDRGGYEVGQMVRLRCYDLDRLYHPVEPLNRVITNILRGGEFELPEGYCILSLAPALPSPDGRAEDLRKLSEAATPGEWNNYGCNITAIGSTDTYSGCVWGSIAFATDTEQSDSNGRNWSTSGSANSNAAFIAALVNAYRLGRLIPALPSPDGSGQVERVRHVKSGGEYEVLGEAEAQISNGRNESDRFGDWCYLYEGNKLTVYRSMRTGKLLCRFTDEFRDGRFVPAQEGQS